MNASRQDLAALVAELAALEASDPPDKRSEAMHGYICGLRAKVLALQAKQPGPGPIETGGG